MLDNTSYACTGAVTEVPHVQLPSAINLLIDMASSICYPHGLLVPPFLPVRGAERDQQCWKNLHKN